MEDSLSQLVFKALKNSSSFIAPHSIKSSKAAMAYIRPVNGWSGLKGPIDDYNLQLSGKEMAAEDDLKDRAKKSAKQKKEKTIEDQDELDVIEWELLQSGQFAFGGRGKKALRDVDSLPKNVEFGRIVNVGLGGGVSETKSMIGSNKRKKGRNNVFNLLASESAMEYVKTKKEGIHKENLKVLNGRMKRNYLKQHQI